MLAVLSELLLSAAVFVALPLVLLAIPVAMWLHHRARQQLLAFAVGVVCPDCGQTIGTRGVEQADILWARHIDRLQHDHPGLRFRLKRTVDIICPACDRWFSARTGNTGLYLHPTTKFVIADEPLVTTKPTQ